MGLLMRLCQPLASPRRLLSMDARPEDESTNRRAQHTAVMSVADRARPPGKPFNYDPVQCRGRWISHLRLLAMAAIVALIATAITMQVPRYLQWRHRHQFLNVLTTPSSFRNPILTAEVSEHADAVVTAGHRACDWAKANPQFPRDAVSLNRRYVTLTSPPDFGADPWHRGVAGFIAFDAWRTLCHVLPDDGD
jgi:hypothetical protein